MKKLVSTTLALAMLAAPVGVMASSADQVSKNTYSVNVYKSEGTEKPKKSHKLRNALIIGATVAGVAVISVATHKAVSKACATGSDNKLSNAICDTNRKVSEISTKAVAPLKTGVGKGVNFLSDHAKSIYGKGKSLFVRKNETSSDETDRKTTEVGQQAFPKESSEEENTPANA